MKYPSPLKIHTARLSRQTSNSAYVKPTPCIRVSSKYHNECSYSRPFLLSNNSSYSIPSWDFLVVRSSLQHQSASPKELIRRKKLTSIRILNDSLWNSAFIRHRDILRLLITTSGAKTSTIIHSPLQSITIPPKNIVSVLTVAGVVPLTEIKWLRAVCGPICFVVELGCIPDDLILLE